MKLKHVLLPLVLLALLLSTVRPAAAQQGKGGGQGPVHYNAAAEVTVTGTVQVVQQVTGPGSGAGTHLTLKTTSGTRELALGPSRYLTQKHYILARGDEITAIGAKATVDGHDVVVVREIKKGSETMTFRDAKGFPMWAGRAGR